MATIELSFDLSDPQTYSVPYALAPEDTDPDDLLIEDVVDDVEPHFTSVMSDDPSLKKPRQTRNRALRESDWEKQRGLITFLYPKMTLDQLMKKMRRRGFHAGRSVYNRYITKWGIKKSFTTSEKQAAIDMRNDPLLEPDPITARPIPPNRLDRYEKDLRRREREALKTKSRYTSKPGTSQTSYLSSPQSVQNTIGMTKKIGSQYIDTVVMNGKFLHSPSERSSELFFMRLQEYVQVRLRAFTSPNLSSLSGVDADMLYETPLSQQNLWGHLKMADSALGAGEMRATFQWLNRACDLARDFFQEAHWRLLVLFERIRDISNLNTDLGERIARFFADMAEVVFYPNSQHCVIQLFRLFLLIDQQDSVLETAGQVALDSVRSVAPNDGTALALMHQDVVGLCRASGMYDSAVRMAKRSIDFCSRTFGPKHYQTRGAMHSLAVTHYNSGRLVDAHQALKTLLQVYDEELVHDECYIVVCLLLGNCCLKLGMLSDATHAYSLPLPTQKWRTNSKHDHRIPLFILERLEYCERMADNIEKRRLRVLSPDDLPDNSVNPGNVPCKHADAFFEECCDHFGW